MNAPTDNVSGTIRFIDRDEPALEAGDYTIAVTQTITPTASPTGSTIPVFTATRNFSVVAPRFTLPPDDVQSVFPPSNARGTFDQNFAHVVLTEPLLPWERLIDAATPGTKSTPWLAVLVVADGDDDSIRRPTSAICTQTGAGSYTVFPPEVSSETVPDTLVVPADLATLGPAVTRLMGDPATCYAIDISTATFTALLPRLQELPFLAHVRDVTGVAQNKTADSASDGMFAVVIGNRLLVPPVDGTPERKHVAHLVSLEGFADYLTDAPAWGNGIKHVRLASLASWTFTTVAEPGNFGELMTNLVAGQAPNGDTLRLRLPLAPESESRTNDATASPADDAMRAVRAALAQGFTALPYDTRFGDHSFAWYHGPLVPYAVAPFAAGAPFASASAATIYDPATGTFDLSYAAAWEAGRLLALANGAYTASTLAAQRATRALVNRIRERTRRDDRVVSPELLLAETPRRAFMAQLVEQLPGLLPRPGLAAVPPRPHAATKAMAGRRHSAPAAVRALHAREDVRALMRGHVADDIAADGPNAGVVSFLGRLRQLAIPFAHLVVDERMLPPESLRFFFVDPNYLDALCDGASSVGVHSGRDAEQRAVAREVLHAEAVASAGDPVAGFLLRSAVVSGWPGLEVKAFSDAGGAADTLIEPVRMERLAPEVLLCLYPSVPLRIDIEEPKEALAFGVEVLSAGGDPVVFVREITGDAVGSVRTDNAGNPVSVTFATATYFRSPARVVNVAQWQAALATNFPEAPAGAWAAGAYGIQMVRAPERMTFTHAAVSAPFATAAE